jgi:hypothetical protein
MKLNKRCLFIFLLLATFFMEPIMAQEDGLDKDLQSWNAIRLTVPVGEKWSVGLQNEARFSDDISKLDEYIIKLYTHYKFSKKFGLSFGGKYIDKPSNSNEWEPWAEAVFPHAYNKWQISHQVRFEARIQQGLEGILPRIRYLFNWTRQLGDSFMYVGGFAAIRFNLADKGAGPVEGFEQIRVNANIGFHLGGITRLEVGYLYRYEVERDAPNSIDNVIHMNLFFTLKRKAKKPLPNDHIL